MKTKEQIEAQQKNYVDEMWAIAELLKKECIQDENLIEKLRQRQDFCRGVSFALSWITGDNGCLS